MESYRGLTDKLLLVRMDQLVSDERNAVAESLACLAEIARRNAYSDLGYPNLFEYCVGHLKYSEASANRRLYAMRAAEARHEIYADLKSGALSLGILSMISSDVLGPDGAQVLVAVRGKRKRQVEEWLAARRPAAPPPPDRVKVLPPAPSKPPLEPSDGFRFDEVQPAPPLPTYQYSFVASPELHRAIERLRDILWNKMPFGNLDDFLQEAVRDYLTRHDPELKLQAQKSAKPVPVTESRRVPNRVRDIVWARDGGRCAFISSEGRRCGARRGLELDHIRPFSAGGRSDDPANIRLLCREHNQLARRQVLVEMETGITP